MLREGLRNHDNKTEMRQSSPPVIYKNLVIVGSSIPDRLQYKNDPPGAIQAFDARTGKRVWVFYTLSRLRFADRRQSSRLAPSPAVIGAVEKVGGRTSPPGGGRR